MWAMSIRPRRSVLYMPGSNVRALEKARSLPADALILDLEDAVAPDAKADARAAIAAALDAGGYGRREVIIRINGFDTEWGEDDLGAMAPLNPDAILVPKVSTAEDIAAASARLEASGAGADTALWVMMETPLAILNARDIAAAASGTRLAAFVMGTNDLAKETGGRLAAGRLPFLGMLGTCVLAARAFGLAIVDGVFNDIADADGFAAECAQGREFGFDGKTLIHPSQIGPCNDAFSPSQDELAQAEKIVEAFALPENAGKGVISVDGRMTELLHAEIARRTVAIAHAIEDMAREAGA